MSDAYFLIDKNKECEFRKFESFWREVFLPETESLLSEYAAKRKKENPGLSETIDEIIRIGKRSIDVPSYCPITDDVYAQRLGTYYSEKDKFVFATWETNITGEEIASVDQLKKFLEEHPSIYISDDCGFGMNFDDFLKETGQQLKGE